MKKLRVGYFADGPWSHNAFEMLIADDSIEFAFIVPRLDTTDDTLKGYSQKHSIDYLFPERINSDSFKTKAREYQCDLFVSMSFNQIFRKDVIALPAMGTINCHAGKLPFYRGRNILNWALINDESEFGITVHFVDEGIDTGDIVLQRCFAITDQDDYGSLLDTSYRECAKILYDAIKRLQEGRANRISQDTIHPLGFTCGRRQAGDEVINWDQGAREVFNFVRAVATPGPLARTRLGGREIRIGKAIYYVDAPKYIGVPGQVLSKTKDGFLVKTQDAFVEIMEIESENKIKVGDRFQ